MNWTSLDQFLQMGGYGLYVWGSYGVTLIVLLAETWAARKRFRTAQALVLDGGDEGGQP